jgi:hypothetical protein
MQTRSLVFALSMISLAACQEDMTEAKASWEKSTKEWATKLETAKKGQADLVARSKTFEMPGADAALVAEKAAIDKGIEASGAAVTDAEQHLTTSKGVIDGLIAKGKKVQVEVALSAEKGVVDGAIAKAQSLVNASNEGLDNLAKKAASIKAAGEAAKSRTEAWTTEAKKKGGMLAIDDLVFNAENVDACWRRSSRAPTSRSTSRWPRSAKASWAASAPRRSRRTSPPTACPRACSARSPAPPPPMAKRRSP